MRRRHALLLNAITAGPLTLFLAPDRFIPWRDHRRAILAALRDTCATPARDVHAIEGLAGSPYEADDADADAVRLLARAREAAADFLPSFHIFTWNETAGAYRLTRPPR